MKRFVLAISSLCLIACNAPTKSETVQKSPIEGVWQRVYQECDGMERGQNWFFGLIFSEGNSMSIQASKQGECFYSAKATYSLSGDAKILEWDVFEYTAEPSENWTASCSTINEDPVVVDIEFDQDTFTFYSPTDEFGRTCSETFSRVMKPKMRNL